MTHRITSWRTGPSAAVDAGGVRAAGPLDPALAARWASGLESWKAPEGVRDRLARLRQGGATVVVTGQQPGAWGGPLYTFLKAATTVALARRLRELHDLDAVAVFWMGSDDADWDEVAWGALPRPDLSLYRHRWPRREDAARRWVGNAVLEAPEEAAAVAAAWGRAPDWGHPASKGPADLGAGLIGQLLRWFGSDGLLPLDARWPEVRRAGAPLWDRYLDVHREAAARVAAEGERLREAGEDAPLGEEAAREGLFLLDGDRRAEGRGAWEEAARSRLGEDGGAGLAPSVLLRAPLQDTLLQPWAQVIGRGEAAYLRQLRPLYDLLEIPVPRRVQRLHATLLPAGVVPREEVVDAVRDPEAWIARAAAERIPPAASARLLALRRHVEGELEAFPGDGGEARKELEQVAASAGRKVDQQIRRLEEVLDRRARQAFYGEEPRRRNLPEFLRPGRGPQDRGLSSVAAEMLLGEAAAPAVLGAAGLHLDRLGEGEQHHFILEALDA